MTDNKIDPLNDCASMNIKDALRSIVTVCLCVLGKELAIQLLEERLAWINHAVVIQADDKPEVQPN